MKKSKIIIPAAAILALSVGASVTGTVAWFTSSRTATVTAKNFASVKTSTSLNVTVAGNEDTGTSGTTNAITVDGKLTHGSYNAVAKVEGSLYVANLNDSETVTSYKDLNTYGQAKTTVSGVTTFNWRAIAKTTAESTYNVWYAVGWTMSFSMKATVDGEVNYLLLDNKDSKFTDGVTGGHTIKGLRIALMTNSKVLVLGGDNTKTHTTGTSINDVKSFDDNDYAVISSDTTGKLEDGATNIASNKYNFGALPVNGTDKITITCVAWFEGSDSNIVNTIKNGESSTETIMSDVSASLEFYSRKA